MKNHASSQKSLGSVTVLLRPAGRYTVAPPFRLGVKFAKGVLQAVRNDVRNNSDSETLDELKCAIAKFQWWQEFLTDAAIRIRLQIGREVY